MLKLRCRFSAQCIQPDTAFVKTGARFIHVRCQPEHRILRIFQFLKLGTRIFCILRHICKAGSVLSFKLLKLLYTLLQLFQTLFALLILRNIVKLLRYILRFVKRILQTLCKLCQTLIHSCRFPQGFYRNAQRLTRTVLLPVKRLVRGIYAFGYSFCISEAFSVFIQLRLFVLLYCGCLYFVYLKAQHIHSACSFLGAAVPGAQPALYFAVPGIQLCALCQLFLQPFMRIGIQ